MTSGDDKLKEEEFEDIPCGVDGNASEVGNTSAQEKLDKLNKVVKESSKDNSKKEDKRKRKKEKRRKEERGQERKGQKKKKENTFTISITIFIIVDGRFPSTKSTCYTLV
jgi:hypothetical protein